ncbi:sulfurtransferase [Xanthomonas nasturtii]|uniref:tRNA uridine(34) hydroxylase n=1 Tax=Xanthomonas nasturtii TaxID=1843581 RepID=A0A3E1KHZ7_9XANT|nr:sulfurtransferase [Xanthomonas nasturtii]MCL1530995.1 sulfurtransferase [Xanthomonas nasturtii]MCL1551638.1 sulfurtransferase [Xanthomonas nasturtii]MCL1555984.1 sulfurtransferase [Xanthomonas nasturtii]MCL1560050.1 sulfurtransferase [Xanthomonas nasturtii]MCL1565776.1 sulfurtransferase [Xanthomonas nasturtii]
MITNTAAYQFVAIQDPQTLAASVLAQAEQRLLKGSVLVAEEGINLFLAGAAEQIGAFYAWLQADARFARIRIKYSESAQQPFARLKVKIKPEIISFRRSDASPLQGRAPSVTPAVLREWMRHGQDDRGRPLVLLDTRNAQEVAYGTFQGALTLPIYKFTDLPDALEPHRAALADTTVVSFCTGGIRCEKAALWMQADGMDNVLQLEGGILGYFEEVGGEGYDGRCFVFDERIALDPALNPLIDGEGTADTGKI